MSAVVDKMDITYVDEISSISPGSSETTVDKSELSKTNLVEQYIRTELYKKMVYANDVVHLNFAVALCKGDKQVVDSIVTYATVSLCDGMKWFLQPFAIESAWCASKCLYTSSQSAVDTATRINLDGVLIPDLISIVVAYSQPVIKVTREMFLDVLDTARVWTIAVIQAVFVFKNETILKIHYLLWGENYDEFIFLSDIRVKFLYNYKHEVVFNWHYPISDKNVEVRHRGSELWFINNDQWSADIRNNNTFNCAPIATFLAPT